MDKQLFSDRHRSYAVECARRITSNADDAEDIAAKAILKCWLKFEALRDDRTIRRWISVIITRTAIDEARARAGKHPISLTQFDERVLRAADFDLRACEDAMVVEAALRHLSLNERAVVVLKHLEAWSSRQVCEALGLTASQVRTINTHAIEKMAAFFGNQRE